MNECRKSEYCRKHEKERKLINHNNFKDMLHGQMSVLHGRVCIFYDNLTSLIQLLLSTEVKHYSFFFFIFSPKQSIYNFKENINHLLKRKQKLHSIHSLWHAWIFFFFKIFNIFWHANFVLVLIAFFQMGLIKFNKLIQHSLNS